MAVYILGHYFNEGITTIPYFWTIIRTLPWLLLLWIIKTWSAGASNKSVRKMHGKVVLITGGTSGVGEAIVKDLAARGAQIVLLTQHPLGDPFLVEYIEDVRRESKNELITAEQVDLASLYSIRAFATKWIDNAPPRRLDLLILCGNTLTLDNKVKSTSEGVELNWQVNYLANFHLMSILSPALRAQPPDRDVRVLFGTCSTYMGGDLLHITTPNKEPEKSKDKVTASPTKFSPGNAYATSKLALVTFALAFQKHLAAYKRPDDFPMNTKVILVDPGFCRTPGTRRWLSRGTIIGLLVYLLTYPFWWLMLKNADMGAQSFLHAAMEETYGRGEGGWLIKECKERKYLREDVQDETAQKQLWQYSERMVEEAEKRGATQRAQMKKAKQDQKDEDDAAKELESYKESVGKREPKKEGSRRSRKAA